MNTQNSAPFQTKDVRNVPSVPGYPSENAYGASVMRVHEPFSP